MIGFYLSLTMVMRAQGWPPSPVFLSSSIDRMLLFVWTSIAFSDFNFLARAIGTAGGVTHGMKLKEGEPPILSWALKADPPETQDALAILVVLLSKHAACAIVTFHDFGKNTNFSPHPHLRKDSF